MQEFALLSMPCRLTSPSSYFQKPLRSHPEILQQRQLHRPVNLYPKDIPVHLDRFGLMDLEISVWNTQHIIDDIIADVICGIPCLAGMIGSAELNNLACPRTLIVRCTEDIVGE